MEQPAGYKIYTDYGLSCRAILVENSSADKASLYKRQEYMQSSLKSFANIYMRVYNAGWLVVLVFLSERVDYG